ncbi:MAG: hypothetical protein NC084_05895 [Bacteroides sp.]|nr:hypothetical protein [Eubacterium sp.]MCM1418087.1 hypothetical protein [Roseburia sp.]MCM1462231.1 hypothetical protein [Bacteroides sp.]
MKKDYKKPEMLVSLFDTKDVITASKQMTKNEDPMMIGGAGSAGNPDTINFIGSGLE